MAEVDQAADEGVARELWDRQQLAEIPLLVSRAEDAGEWERLRALFTEDATYESASAGHRKIDEVIQRSRSLAAQYERNMHYLSNQLVELKGDGGQVDSYAVAYHWMGKPAGSDDPANLVTGDRYTDTLVRHGDSWLIAHRHLERIWHTGPLPTPPSR